MTPAKYDITAIGLPFVDYISNVTDAFLKQAKIEKGSCREYTTIDLAKLRRALPNFAVWAGGSPPNTCAGIVALRGSAVFLGRVCDDEAGNIFRKDFAERGVIFPNASYATDRQTASGMVFIMTTQDGASTFAASPGIGKYLSEADILPGYIEQSKVLFIQAEFLEIERTRPAAEKAIRIAHTAGREVVISLHGQDFTTQSAAIFRRDYLPLATMLDGNWDQYNSLFRPFTPSDFIDGDQLMIVTRGKDGAYIIGRDNYLHIPAHPPRVFVNDVGPGDAFAAGFFRGYARGLDLQSCGEMGAEAASAILEIAAGRPDGSWEHIASKYLRIGPETSLLSYVRKLTA